MSSNCYSDLPVSRVNRILRPLRNKCALLASTTSSSSRRSRAANPITYSSNPPSSQWQADDHPPLAILQTPQHLVSRVHLDRHSLGNLDLSRKIYAVVDAFKNVLQASFGAERDEGEKTAFLSLTDICAAVVGENVQAEVEWTAEDDDDDEEDIEEDAERAIVDDIYEAVPSRFRRYVYHNVCHRQPYSYMFITAQDGLLLLMHCRSSWTNAHTILRS